MTKPSHDFLARLCLIPCVEKLDRRFNFDWLTSGPDYNPALTCAGSPRRFSSQDLQDRTCHSFLEWQEKRLQYPFGTDGILLEVRNWKERTYAWILMLQLVTSKPGAIAIPEAQSTQHFLVPQCPGTSWLLALTVMYPPTFFWLIVRMTSLVMP
jgi:hypothetical protein